MDSCVNLHSQLASIMEVLANAAVAEICQLVDDGFASLRLEISRSQRENLALKSRLRLMEVQARERAHRGTLPPLMVTCTRKDTTVKSTMLQDLDSQQPQGGVTKQPVELEVAVIKRERLEDQQDPQTPANITPGPMSLCPDGVQPLAAAAGIPSTSHRSEEQDSGRLEAQQQDEVEGVSETRTLGLCCLPAEQNHRGPNRDQSVVDSRAGVSTESRTSPAPDGEAPLMKRLDSEMPSSDAGVRGLCDWRGEVVKLETKASWSAAFRTRNTVTTTENVSLSRFTNYHNTQGDAAELDTNSLDSSSFDDLFSCPEVAQSLMDSQKPPIDRLTGVEESLCSSSFPSLSNDSSFGNSSVSDFLTSSSLSKAPEPKGRDWVFSCPQCGRLFCTSRDLVVHQRAHAGERIYHCNLCRKPFIHPHQLKTHQRVHTGEKPFSCAQCGKRFSQSSHIKRHMSVHTGEKRYSCSLCGKRFSQACSLKVHQAVHTGERPYSCTKCGKSFSVLGNLVRHQSVHMGK